MNKLVTVTNHNIIEDLRKIPNVSLAYPLKSFCVGYQETFDIAEIDDFCIINRILNDRELDTLEEILKKANIKGIIFDDLGIIDILSNYDFTKILYLDHIATNSMSINYYLDYVDSIIISNDLTKEEITTICQLVKKPVVVNVFGLKTLMYSRRSLVSNYETHHQLPLKTNIDASIEDKHFKIVENAYGTKFYAYPYYNALELLDLKNVLYFWYDPIFLDNNLIINLIKNNDTKNIPNNPLFLDKKTFYKVGDIDA